MQALLRSVANAFSAAEGAPVLAEFADELPSVHADGSEVRQAVVNLVTNALKHSPTESAVRMSAARRGDAVRVEVTDSGPGIPAEHLPHLWERFYRVPGDATQGSGLGLAIAKRLIERQGGRVGADSQLGRGSTFWFDLPTSPRT